MGKQMKYLKKKTKSTIILWHIYVVFNMTLESEFFQIHTTGKRAAKSDQRLTTKIHKNKL